MRSVSHSFWQIAIPHQVTGRPQDTRRVWRISTEQRNKTRTILPPQIGGKTNGVLPKHKQAARPPFQRITRNWL